jgi:hypothetical protein
MLPALGLRADGRLFHCNADHLERRWIMKSHFRKLAVESLEGRSVLSTVDFGDLNNDGRDDMAAITSPTTVTISLANADGSYTVSAVLTAPKNQSLSYVDVSDFNGDGNQDVYASGPGGGEWLQFTRWLGNGDGTFDAGTSNKWRWPKGNNHGSW